MSGLEIREMKLVIVQKMYSNKDIHVFSCVRVIPWLLYQGGFQPSYDVLDVPVTKTLA